MFHVPNLASFLPEHAIRIGHRLAEFGIDWYEEPCLSENIDLVAEVRRAVPIPIVTGEAIYSKEAFFECLAKRAADILNPDICAVGGITAMLDIAAMAQPQAVVMPNVARRPAPPAPTMTTS